MSAGENKAVFLSYASQDAEAARRICDALRAAEVEVWFDQSELRGGDAWDQKIRKQIKECALFVPIISASTQARLEGYFRLEWLLAVERSRLMAEERAFLVPVVIDDTTDAAARVPEKFREVQWTRLMRGDPKPAFVARLTNLLAGPVEKTAPAAPTISGSSVSTPSRQSGRPRWTAAVLGALVLGLVAYIALRPAVKDPADGAPTNAVSATNPAPATPARAEPPALPNDKSIAVLPFSNLSDDKDANAFFADGIHEEILTNLALIAELRVVSRTSVEQYRKTTKPLPQIARELGVAWVLEGSVFRAGGKVRVTGQLIRGATDEHAWAKSYNRDLTDIFAIQAELAQSIAGALHATISSREKNLLERPTTRNLAAYDLYLKAREMTNRGIGMNLRTEALLQSAVELDPGFVKAWCDLMFAQVSRYWSYRAHTPAQLAKARAALDTAIRLAPDSPDTLVALGVFHDLGLRDYARAHELYRRVMESQPNNSVAVRRIGNLFQRQGKWPESLPYLRRAAQMDPANPQFASNLTTLFVAARRYEEARAEQRRMVNLVPDSPGQAFRLCHITFLATGSTREGDELLKELRPEDAARPQWLAVRRNWARTRGDFVEATRLDGLSAHLDEDDRWVSATAAAIVLAAQGDRSTARARLERFPAELRAQLATDPSNDWLWSGLASMEMVVGDPAEARRCALKAVELLPESVDAVAGLGRRAVLASVYAWTGDPERALAELARLLRAPLGANVHELRHGPEFFPLRGDPRFEALLADSNNNAPLF